MAEIRLLNFNMHITTVQVTSFDMRNRQTVGTVMISYTMIGCCQGWHPGEYPVRVDSNNAYFQTTNQGTLTLKIKHNDFVMRHIIDSTTPLEG